MQPLLNVLIILSLISCSVYSRKQHLIEKGNQIIVKIEAYQNENLELPDTIKQIGIPEKMEGPIYYLKKSKYEYIIWFGNEVGESTIYDSNTNKWRDF